MPAARQVPRQATHLFSEMQVGKALLFFTFSPSLALALLNDLPVSLLAHPAGASKGCSLHRCSWGTHSSTKESPLTHRSKTLTPGLMPSMT